MRKFVLLLTIVLFLPSLSYALDIACDIVVIVYEETESTGIESILVACYSFEEEIFAYDRTDRFGKVYFDMSDWPNAGGCDQNYGDYRLCLPWFWEAEDVSYEAVGDCSKQSGCTVEFYIDEGDKKATTWCTDLPK